MIGQAAHIFRRGRTPAEVNPISLNAHTSLATCESRKLPMPLRSRKTSVHCQSARSTVPFSLLAKSTSPTAMKQRRYTISRSAVLKLGNHKKPRRQFGAARGPTVTPLKDYVPVRSKRKPPFHAEIEVASNLPDDSPEFRTFVLNVVGMPEHMASNVAAAIRQQKWKISPNPLASIRTAAHQEAQRKLLPR